MNKHVHPLFYLFVPGQEHIPLWLLEQTKLTYYTNKGTQLASVKVTGTNQGIGEIEEGPPRIEGEKFDCYCCVVWLFSIPCFPH